MLETLLCSLLTSNQKIDLLPFLELQEKQSGWMFSIKLDPPLLIGTIWSTVMTELRPFGNSISDQILKHTGHLSYWLKTFSHSCVVYGPSALFSLARRL